MPQVAIMLPNGTVEKVDRESKESLDALRQVAALLLKAALQDQFKGIRLGEAVAEEDQFFVDSDKDNQQVSADELEGLESVVKKLAKENLKIELVKVSVDDAVKAVEGDQFSSELLKENAEDGQVSLYKMGDATILAQAPIMLYANLVKNVKLLSVAGAYWKGMSSNPMLQRIYGTVFFKKEDLEADLKARQQI